MFVRVGKKSLNSLVWEPITIELLACDWLTVFCTIVPNKVAAG